MSEATPNTVTRRVAAGLLLGAVLGAVLLHLVLRGRFEAQASGRADRAAMMTVRAAAAIATAQGGEGEAMRLALEQWRRSHPAVRNYRVINIDNRSIEASTFPDDLKEGDVPRTMVRPEKPLYDLAQTIRANVETNDQEKSAREEEVAIEPQAGGALLLTAPVEKDGAVVGAVQVLVAPQTVAAAAPPVWIALAFALAPFVAFLAVASFLRSRGVAVQVVVAAALLLVALFLYRNWAVSALVSGARSVEAAFATQLQQEAKDVAAVATGAEQSAATWDADVYRQPRKIDVAASVKGQRDAVVSASWGIAALSLAALLFLGLGAGARLRYNLVKHRQAYIYVAPALFGMLLLVFFPFFYGITLSFTSQNIYSVNKPLHEIWVGLQNYSEILGDFNIIRHTNAGCSANYENFYWTLFFTIVWTVTNVTIGVTVGLLLALILNTKGLRFKAGYRVLLILPWAVPNYITALIWKGMFHQQFGVINQMIQIFGGKPISWFEKPFTAFVAVVTTNGWLSFPFMMVISLGALQSIPADLYEAARVDGATRWQQFTAITLPSLKPALVPAIILSVVWTFNMFNIIYLVSAGEPAKSTEILITQAYKIAFEQYRYGYAAAYSTVIFAILLIYGVFQNRAAKATESIA